MRAIARLALGITGMLAGMMATAYAQTPRFEFVNIIGGIASEGLFYAGYVIDHNTNAMWYCSVIMDQTKPFPPAIIGCIPQTYSNPPKGTFTKTILGNPRPPLASPGSDGLWYLNQHTGALTFCLQVTPQFHCVEVSIPRSKVPVSPAQ